MASIQFFRRDARLTRVSITTAASYLSSTTFCCCGGRRYQVSALAVAESDTAVEESDDGHPTAWRWDGSCLSLSVQEHGAEVVAVALAGQEGLACSASRDGHLPAWSYAEPGRSNFQTFVDVEHAAVGCFDRRRGLSLLDRKGEVHRRNVEAARS